MTMFYVQKISFDEFERNELVTESMKLTNVFKSESFDDCRSYFDEYCSGANDDMDGFIDYCACQNFSRGHFYRIYADYDEAEE